MPEPKRIWVCCSVCGSTDVIKDAIAAWDDEAQAWELVDVYDKTNYCRVCDEEVSLDDVEVVPDGEIADAIRETGWFLNECEDGTYQVKWFHGDPDATGPFQTTQEAYLWALYHEPEEGS